MEALRAAFIGDSVWLQLAILFFWGLCAVFMIGLVQTIRAKRGR